jgi:hypothetical protein
MSPAALQGIVDPLFSRSAVRTTEARPALKANLQVQASLPLIEPDIDHMPGRLQPQRG